MRSSFTDAPDAYDATCIRIIGTLLFSDHVLDQVANQFLSTNSTDTSKLSNVRLYRNHDSDQVLSAGDEQVGTAGTYTVSNLSGLVTFSTDVLASSTFDYILVVDLDGVRR